MKGPYGLEITDSCAECTNLSRGFFCEFSDAVLQSLDRVSHKTILPAGAILFVEGQATRGVYLVRSGRVKLSIASAEGKKLIVRIARAGDLLGIRGALTGHAYEATAETLAPCRIDFVTRTNLLALLDQHHSLARTLAIAASNELSEYIDHARVLYLSDSAGEKLARLLLRLIEEFGESTDNGICFQTMLTHEEIAQMIGASRETVTRELSALKRKQIVRGSNGRLLIPNRAALAALAHRGGESEVSRASRP